MDRSLENIPLELMTAALWFQQAQNLVVYDPLDIVTRSKNTEANVGGILFDRTQCLCQCLASDASFGEAWWQLAQVAMRGTAVKVGRERITDQECLLRCLRYGKHEAWAPLADTIGRNQNLRIQLPMSSCRELLDTLRYYGSSVEVSQELDVVALTLDKGQCLVIAVNATPTNGLVWRSLTKHIADEIRAISTRRLDLLDRTQFLVRGVAYTWVQCLAAAAYYGGILERAQCFNVRHCVFQLICYGKGTEPNAGDTLLSSIEGKSYRIEDPQLSSKMYVRVPFVEQLNLSDAVP